MENNDMNRIDALQADSRDCLTVLSNMRASGNYDRQPDKVARIKAHLDQIDAELNTLYKQAGWR